MYATRSKSPRQLIAVIALGCLVAGALIASPAQAAVVVDGSASQRAAASCWEIKQNQPAAQDGRYWLITPQLKAPAQFYCDMTTDGGGWVLVGRGRENWLWGGDGRGTTSDVSSTVTGSAAFSPRQLSDSVIDGLLGGRRLDSFPDHVRLRRATNTSGTNWQDVRFSFKSRDRWSWAFGAGHPISSFSIDGSNGSNSSTRDFGTDSSYRRVTSYDFAANNYVRGFNFGQNGTGTTAASSYIYASGSGGRNGSPFTQVFIRPRITTAAMTYASIPDSGTAAETALAVAQSGALVSTWGVTGTGAGGTGELGTEVKAFAQIGNTMYVGGNFTTVRNSAGSTNVAQPYLAAFNATTGDWISSFRPTFNNQVNALAVLPGGKLAVGGNFTKANGATRSGLVVLNTSTAALDPLWDSNVENRVSGGVVSVRGLDTSSTHLYATGSFTHFVRGSSAPYTRNGARLSLSTGRPDSGWNPEFNGTGTAVDVDDNGSRVYFAGYFTKSRSTTINRGAAVSTGTSASLVNPIWQSTSSSSGARYQQAVRQIGDKVWLGGSQHNMFAYDTSTFALKSSSITKSGGDIQAIDGANGVIYGGCHCADWNYYGTTNYDSLSPGQSTVSWSQADKISLVGAWRTDTGTFIPAFAPQWRSRGGNGAWALKVASDGTLWSGGSLTSVVKENGANQWTGGFARFAQRPHTAPGAPTSPSVQLTNSTAKVTWTNGSTSGATYEVIRNDRVVATTTGSSADISDSSPGDRFFVRASDGEGNRSTSTAAVRPAAGANATVLAAGSSWRYLFDNTVTVNPSWKEPSFSDAAWTPGSAPLGWGPGPIATDIDVPTGQTRALTSYFRKSFTVAAPGSFQSYALTTRADDGIVVYVNGTEVTRANMPAGTITSGSYATTARSTSTALADPVTVQIPTSLIQAGSNTIAVEVHSNYRSTPNTSMDVTIEAQQ